MQLLLFPVMENYLPYTFHCSWWLVHMRMCVCKSSLAIMVIQEEKKIYNSEPMKNLGKKNNILGLSLQTWYNLDKKLSVVASEDKQQTFQKAHKEKVKGIRGNLKFCQHNSLFGISHHDILKTTTATLNCQKIRFTHKRTAEIEDAIGSSSRPPSFTYYDFSENVEQEKSPIHQVIVIALILKKLSHFNHDSLLKSHKRNRRSF